MMNTLLLLWRLHTNGSVYLLGVCRKSVSGLALLLGLGMNLSADAARLALVVGNDAYRNVPELKNAGSDAELIARTLEAAGFRVTLQRNLDRQALFSAIDTLQGQLNNGDEVAFFFAGHGVQVGSDQVLLPVDIRADDERKLLREGIPLLYVQDALKAARFAMMVVDACRDNPFATIGTRSIGEARGLKPPEVAQGQVVILSAGRGEKALDSVPGDVRARNGLFTWEFAQVLRTPGLDVLSALRSVRDRVEDRAASVGHRQRPSLVDDLRGQFHLFGSAGSAVDATGRRPLDVSLSAPLPVPTPSTSPPLAASPLSSSPPLPGAVFKDCSSCPEMVAIPAGRFMMGSPRGEPGRESIEGPQRSVGVGAFAAGRFEVTIAEWAACWSDGGCRTPVENVATRGKLPVTASWHDAQEFIRWLSSKTGRPYRLLSEAEWEYSARAGSTTAYPWGVKASRDYANYGKDKGPGTWAEGRDRWLDVAPVGQFPPNAFGLYDMHGNMWEWVQDTRHSTFAGAPRDATAWITGGDETDLGWRVLRGGSYNHGATDIRSASRWWAEPTFENFHTGFRVARAL